ncbi:MAG: hypothetical protein J5I53_05165 [Bradyrhizobiaceae bacterium]|nr:hypothetical protein [Bradyrhizobiaceae bacterium]
MRCLLQSLLLLCVGFASINAGEPGWRALPPLPQVRSGHGVVMVHTGDVLVVGGRDGGGTCLASAVLINGASGQNTPTINTDVLARTNASVVVAPSSTKESIVYIIGGYTGTAGNYSSTAAVSRLRYDALQQNWRFESVGQLPVAVGDCRAVYDGSGSIVVSGGITQNGGAIASGQRSSASATIDVATGVIRRLGDHINARAEHGVYRFIDQTNATVVMAAGGEATPPPSSELLAGTTWDPRANAPQADRRRGVPVSDITGTARIFGGQSNGAPVATCEWYDPKSGWRNAPRMIDSRSDFATTLVASPTDTAAAYLVVAGTGTAGALRSCEMFLLPTSTDPAGVWNPFDALITAAASRGVALTSSNVPVVAGGSGTAGVEVYQPLRCPDVSFPSTEVGARSDSVWIEVSNNWVLPIMVKKLTLLDGADFIIAADTTVLKLAPQESRRLLAWFRPSQPGLRTSRVVLDMGAVTDTLRLSGVGLASTVSVVTSVMDHGEVPVGTANRLCMPLLRNNGSDTAWVDSIVVDPPGAYTIESPTGKTPVPPGTELQVCIVFKPSARGAVVGTATMRIGPHAYPVAVLGKGIRTLAVVRPALCDTVSAQRNDQITVTALIENVGDKDVTVSAINILPTLPGTAVLANPSVVPFTLRAGQLMPIDVIYTVQREGQERIQLTATSTSDSAIEGTLCVVVVSRSVVMNVSAINAGDLCIGDTVRSTVVLTNASATDSIFITDVVVENTSQASVSAAQNVVIAPRSSYVIAVTVGASQSGTLNGAVVVNTNNGSASIPVIGRVLDAVTLSIPDVTMAPGETIQVPLGIGATTASQLIVDMAFATDMLAITGVQSIAGEVQLDPSSTVQRSAGQTRLTLVWQGAPPSTATQINLVVEGLRGSDVVTDIRAKRAGNDQACVLTDTGTVRVNPACGQTRSLVKVGKGANVQVVPSPVVNVLQVNVTSTTPEPLWLRVVDAQGLEIANVPTASGVHGLNMTTAASGAYCVQLFSAHGLLDQQLFILQH